MNKSGAVYQKSVADWLDPKQPLHLWAFGYYQRHGSFPEGFLPSEVWLAPHWYEETFTKLRDFGVTSEVLQQNYEMVRKFLLNYAKQEGGV